MFWQGKGLQVAFGSWPLIPVATLLLPLVNPAHIGCFLVRVTGLRRWLRTYRGRGRLFAPVCGPLEIPRRFRRFAFSRFLEGLAGRLRLVALAFGFTLRAEALEVRSAFRVVFAAGRGRGQPLFGGRLCDGRGLGPRGWNIPYGLRQGLLLLLFQFPRLLRFKGFQSYEPVALESGALLVAGAAQFPKAWR